MPSMADIAKEAGVHKMTVSRALSGQKYVSDEVREKVHRAAEKLGYKKNNLISSVMAKVARSKSVDYGTPIVYLSDAPSEEHLRMNGATQRIVKRGREHAARYGFSFETMLYRDDSMSHQRLNEILEARGIQGLIVNVAEEDPIELDLNWDRLVAVTSGGRLKAPRDLPQVHSDIPRYMTRIFAEADVRGYQRVGFVLHDGSIKGFSSFWLSSVLEYQYGLAEDRRIPVLSCGYDLQREEFLQWFRLNQPDLIVTFLGDVHEWLVDDGFEIPEEIGFIHTSIGDEGSRCAGILQDHGLLAEAAVDQVVHGLMAGNYGIAVRSDRHLIPFAWQDGDTLRPKS